MVRPLWKARWLVAAVVTFSNPAVVDAGASDHATAIESSAVEASHTSDDHATAIESSAMEEHSHTSGESVHSANEAVSNAHESSESVHSANEAASNVHDSSGSAHSSNEAVSNAHEPSDDGNDHIQSASSSHAAPHEHGSEETELHGHAENEHGSDSHEAYAKRYEHDFVESICLIIILCLALVFETLWHWMSHHADKSYQYGMLHDEARRNIFEEPHLNPDLNHSYGHVKHIRLHQELTSRAGGEFMILGFISFVVFCCNEFGLFRALADVLNSRSSENFHIPHTEHDLLKVAEMVHVKLFLGMFVYFFLISRIISGSVERMQRWERARIGSERVSGALACGHSVALALSAAVVDKDMAQYLCWRDYFIEKMLHWRTTRPHVFDELHQVLDVDGDCQAQFLERFQERFALSAYLALGVGNGVRDSIVVHKETWAAVISVVTIFALCERYLAISLMKLTPVLVAVAVIVLLIMYIVVKKVQGDIVLQDQEIQVGHKEAKRQKQGSKQKLAELAGNVRTNVRLEMVMLRLLQVVLFLISYSFARTAADLHDWQHDPQTTGLFSAILGLLVVVLALVLPNEVPIFLAVMALPPFEHDTELTNMFAVITRPDLAGVTAVPLPLRSASSFGAASPCVTTPHVTVALSNKIAVLHSEDDHHQEPLKALEHRLAAAEAQMSSCDGETSSTCSAVEIDIYNVPGDESQMDKVNRSMTISRFETV